jgi:hypothetical protein
MPLLYLGGFPEGAGEHAASVVSHALASWSFSSCRVEGVSFVHGAGRDNPLDLLRDRFGLGRALARALDGEPPLAWPPSSVATLDRYPLVRLRAIARTVLDAPQLALPLVRAAPLVLTGLGATVVGTWVERVARALRP